MRRAPMIVPVRFLRSRCRRNVLSSLAALDGDLPQLGALDPWFGFKGLGFNLLLENTLEHKTKLLALAQDQATAQNIFIPNVFSNNRLNKMIIIYELEIRAVTFIYKVGDILNY